MFKAILLTAAVSFVAGFFYGQMKSERYYVKYFKLCVDTVYDEYCKALKKIKNDNEIN